MEPDSFITQLEEMVSLLGSTLDRLKQEEADIIEYLNTDPNVDTDKVLEAIYKNVDEKSRLTKLLWANAVEVKKLAIRMRKAKESSSNETPNDVTII
jgi:hypothetical protein